MKEDHGVEAAYYFRLPWHLEIVEGLLHHLDLEEVRLMKAPSYYWFLI
jgi:hypothetical protein